MARDVVILDGGEGADASRPALAALVPTLEHRGYTVRVVSVHSLRLAHCIGCFRCWVKSPGACSIHDDGAELVRLVVSADLLVLFSPVSFGGYSSALKQMVDRFALPTLLPYFKFLRGETHHPLRYARAPRLLALGVQEREDPREADIFRVLAGRNAVNFHAPSHAAEVLPAGDSNDALRRCVEAVIERSDPRPYRLQVDTLMPEPHPVVSQAPGTAPRHALLIVGSPKAGHSNSAVLGHHVLARLVERGIETSEVVLKPLLRSAPAQADLVEHAKRADLVVLAFPLYVDALPTLATRALEVLWAHRSEWASGDGSQRLLAICNSGFPEAHQTTLALAICERFAAATGMHFSGGLKLGGGEAIVNGLPLSQSARHGRPPGHHVIQALDIAASALSRGKNVPAEANALLAKSPIPFVPFALWQWVVHVGGTRGWTRMAAANGIRAHALVARPIAPKEVET